MSEDNGSAAIEVRHFVPSYETFGIVLDYIALTPPFDRFPSGKLAIALKHQIARRHHVCAFRGEQMLGYCGWLYTTERIGRAWVAGTGELDPVDDRDADAAALTIVRAEDKAALQAMIRAIREIGKGKRIFFRRDYAGARPRRRSVLNV